MRSSLASATSLLALLLLDGRGAYATVSVTTAQPASFGDVLVGTTTTAHTALVTVSGQTSGTALTVGAGVSPFNGSAISTTTGSATTSVTASFTFSPASTGTFSQVDVATDTTGGSNSVSITLTGTGVAPLASITSTSAGYVLVGSSATATVTVANAGNAYLIETAGSRTVNNTAYNLNGSITGGNSVFVGTASSIALQDSNYTGAGAKSSASYAYTFKPTVMGAASTTIVTSLSDGVGATNVAGSITTTVTGTGVAAVESVSNAVIYGRLGSGSVSNGAITVANIGNANLAGTGTAYNLNGSVAAVSSGAFSVSAASISLASNATGSTSSTATSTLGYTYTPGSARATTSTTATIAFTDGNSAGTNLSQSVAATITGSAVGPTYQSSIRGGAVDTPTVKGTSGSVASAGSTISFGTVGKSQSQTVYLALQNTTTDANGGNALLTDLTIDKYTITGVNASAFSISSIGGSVITEGGMLLVPITVTGTSLVGTLNSTLTIFTDESVALGGAGDTFTYALTAYSVPEPTSLAVLGAGLAGLASFRRRRTPRG